MSELNADITEADGLITIVSNGRTTKFERDASRSRPDSDCWIISEDGKQIGSLFDNPGKYMTPDFYKMVVAFNTVHENNAQVAKLEAQIAAAQDNSK